MQGRTPQLRTALQPLHVGRLCQTVQARFRHQPHAQALAGVPATPGGPTWLPQLRLQLAGLQAAQRHGHRLAAARVGAHAEGQRVAQRRAARGRLALVEEDLPRPARQAARRASGDGLRARAQASEQREINSILSRETRHDEQGVASARQDAELCDTCVATCSRPHITSVPLRFHSKHPCITRAPIKYEAQGVTER